MLNHSGVGAFRPFASPPEDRDGAGGGYQSAFTPAKRLKGCLEAEASPHLRYSDAEGKEYDFGGAQIPSSSPSALKAVEDAGKKIFAVSGLLSDRETSSSPEDRIERCEYTANCYICTLSNNLTNFGTTFRSQNAFYFCPVGIRFAYTHFSDTFCCMQQATLSKMGLKRVIG